MFTLIACRGYHDNAVIVSCSRGSPAPHQNEIRNDCEQGIQTRAAASTRIPKRGPSCEPSASRVRTLLALAAKCFGLDVMDVMINRPETWTSEHFEKDGVPIKGRPYFTI